MNVVELRSRRNIFLARHAEMYYLDNVDLFLKDFKTIVIVRKPSITGRRSY
jgi:hypothetical protein